MDLLILRDTTFWLGVVVGWVLLALVWLLAAGSLYLYHQADLSLRIYAIHRRIRRRQKEEAREAASRRATMAASAARGERRIELLKGSHPKEG